MVIMTDTTRPTSSSSLVSSSSSSFHTTATTKASTIMKKQSYTTEDLEIFNILRHPVWVFDMDEKCMYWANTAALQLWNATSLEELIHRDFITDMSEVSQLFLQDAKTKFHNDIQQSIAEKWTFYPKGMGPITINVTVSGIPITSSQPGQQQHMGMLNEAECNIHDHQIIAEQTIRSIEILKHIPIAVSQFTTQGQQLIYQNPQANQLFGTNNTNTTTSSTIPDQNISITTSTPVTTATTTTTNITSQKEIDISQTTMNHEEEKEGGEEEVIPDSCNEKNDGTKILSPPPLMDNDTTSLLIQRFVDTDIAKMALQQIQDGMEFSAEVQQYTLVKQPQQTSSSNANNNDHGLHLKPKRRSSESDNIRWFNVSLRRTKDPVTSDDIILYIARDISDIVKARKDTTRAAMKSEFLDVMAHEIRTPLHQIVGHVDLLEDSGLTKDQLSSVQQIQNSSSLLMSIINDLLDCSKLERGHVEIEAIPFALDTLIHACVSSIRPQSDKKQLSLSSQIDPKIETQLISDPNRLRQILHNLLSNAVKFTSAGSISLLIKQVGLSSNISINDHDNIPSSSSSSSSSTGETPSRQQRLRFEVIDTGIGISMSEQTVVFERYQQANASVSRHYGGTGLGLPICKGLVELMNGTIGLTSELGKGTTVFFEIPFQIAAHSYAPTKRNSFEGSPCKKPVMKILVVEDNVVNQKVVLSMLQRLGHVVSVAENGQIALNQIRQQQFHLVLMDIQMPVMDGIECTKYIRDVLQINKRQLPIVGLTAGYQHSDQLYYENVIGMNSCLGKPLKLEALKNAINFYNKVIK